MIAELLGRVAVLLVLRPQASAAEVVLVAGVALLALAAATVVPVTVGATAVLRDMHPFDDVRALLRADDPRAPGHPMARAPGAAG